MIQKFEFKETEIKGLIEVTPFNADDIRGCFTKDYSKEVFEANGIKHDLAEVFYTTSYKGVIRALHNEILVPAGCAHGYLVLEDSIVSYKCGEKFYGEYDDGIMWNDPDIAVDWKLDRVGGIDKVILADKDKNLQTFKEFMSKYGGF